MTVEVEDIRAWVDGELDELRATEVGNAVLSDQGLQRTADKLRASQLPYREAYEQVPVADVPESLQVSIEALRNPSIQNTEVHTQAADAANNSSFKMIGIAASVMLAALAGYLAGANKASRAPVQTVSVDTPAQTDDFARTVALILPRYQND